MRQRLTTTCLALLLALLAPTLIVPARAAEAPPAQAPLVVATNRAPPFVFLDDPTGRPTGLTVKLIETIAHSLGRTVDWRPMAFGEVLETVTSGRVDLAAAALTVTAEREKVMDFSQPFLSTGLGIAVVRQPPGGGLELLRALLSRTFLDAVGGLALTLAVVGVLIWLIEHRANREEFGGGLMHGIGNGFWWSAVTMSTVGYGDKSPRTLIGRVLGVVWMFVSVILISSFTATITASLTVNRLEGLVSGPRDLPRVRVATVANTAATRYLDNQGIHYRGLTTLAQALDSLSRHEVDAVVYDAPLLSYQISLLHNQELKLLDAIFARQNYAIAMPTGSPWRKPVNEALLALLNTPAWQDELEQWLPAP